MTNCIRWPCTAETPAATQPTRGGPGADDDHGRADPRSQDTAAGQPGKLIIAASTPGHDGSVIHPVGKELGGTLMDEVDHLGPELAAQRTTQPLGEGWRPGQPSRVATAATARAHGQDQPGQGQDERHQHHGQHGGTPP